MDYYPPQEQDVGGDLETGIIYSLEEGNGEILPKTGFTKLCDRFMSVDDNLVKMAADPLNVKEDSSENNAKASMEMELQRENGGDFTGKKMGREKRKKASSAKKPPKPPRPPRGFSLDAADQKLIKELAELAMLKRVRIERMKALKQKKSLKASSSSSSSLNGSSFAMLFTILFFLVMFFQGISSRNSGATFPGSPQTAQTNENGLIFIQEQLNPSAGDSILPNSKSSK